MTLREEIEKLRDDCKLHQSDWTKIANAGLSRKYDYRCRAEIYESLVIKLDRILEETE